MLSCSSWKKLQSLQSKERLIEVQPFFLHDIINSGDEYGNQKISAK